MSTCDCIVAAKHKSRCGKKATILCEDCGDQLCGGCYKNHHPNSGKWKPILQKGEYVATTAYYSLLSPWEKFTLGVQGWVGFFIHFVYTIKESLAEVWKETR